MSSITLHNLKPDLDKMIKKKAKKEGLSINKMVQKLLQQALGLNSKRRKEDFSEFCNVWSAAEYEEFISNTGDFDRIDKEDWK
jgi:hypothetical protein